MAGSPIRRSPHQRLLAPTRSISQLGTTFLGARAEQSTRWRSILPAQFHVQVHMLNHYRSSVMADDHRCECASTSLSTILFPEWLTHPFLKPWTGWDLNPWPPACKAGDLPLIYRPTSLIEGMNHIVSR